MNDLSMHIMDIVQNSLSAGATLVRVAVEEDIPADRLTITIEDNGRGMTQEKAAMLSDPFYTTRTTRRVGMGIPLFRQTAEQSGGRLDIESAEGKGTVIRAVFVHSDIDRPPLGDIANSFMLSAAGSDGVEFILEYIYNGEAYSFDTRDAKAALETGSLNYPAVIKMLSGMIAENIKEIKSGR